MADSLKVRIDGDDSGLEKTLSSLGNGAKKAMGWAVKGVTAASTALAGLTTLGIKAYGEFEQLEGGMKKIFDQADTSAIMADAKSAYKTLGMSANEYLSVINDVGATFAATMGDQKGYEAAKVGLTAISDYATGTGKSIEDLSGKFTLITRSTSSYQSIADQFSGVLPATSKDFLNQAQAAGFLSDKYSELTQVPVAEYQEAVSKMLEKGVADLGLAGNTAAEAATTLTGSLQMTKASWSNLMAGFADDNANFDELLNNFVESVVAFGDNLLPRIQTTLQGISTFVTQAAETLIPTILETITSSLPGLLSAGVQLISSLIQGVVQALPGIVTAIAGALPGLIQGIVDSFTLLVEALPAIIQTIVQALPTLIPALITGVVDMVVALCNNFSAIIQPLIDSLPDIIVSIIEAIVNNLPALIQGIITLVMGIVEAIPQIIQGIVDALPTIISLIIESILGNLPAIIGGLIQVVFGIVKSLPQIFGSLIKGVVNTLAGIWDGLGKVFGKVGNWFGEKFSAAKDAIKTAWTGITDWFSNIWTNISNAFAPVDNWFKEKFSAGVEGIKNVWSSITQWFANIWNSIKSIFVDAKDQFLSIGKNIVDGIKNGISNAWKNLKEWFKGLFGNLIDIAKNILGIKSPSRVFRDEVGKMITQGLAVGIDEGKTEVQKVMTEMNEELLESEEKYIAESKRLEEEAEREKVEEAKKTAKETLDEDLKTAKSQEEIQKAHAKYNKKMAEIEADEIKRIKEKANEEYLEGLKNSAEKERMVYDAMVKDLENMKDRILDAYDEILDAETDFAEGLKDDIKLFDETKITIGGAGEHGEDLEFSKFSLSDISSQTDSLKNYSRRLEELKSKADIPQEFFAQFKEMSVEEGSSFLDALLGASDEELQKYISDWEEYRNTSDVLAEQMYADDYAAMVDSFKDEFGTLPEGFFDIGKESGENFSAEFIEKIKTKMAEAKTVIESTLSEISLNIQVQADSRGGIVNNYSSTYNINAPDSNSTSLLEGARRLESMNKFLGVD